MTDWWESFFSGPWLDVQTRSHTAEQTAVDADWIEEAMALRRGARVLDVPCGNGRIALELRARGYDVTGIDITEPLLAAARDAASQRGLEMRLERRDMRDLPWKEEFDAVFCWWGSFGYFDEEGNRAFVEAAYRVLQPGGRFLIETLTAETLFPVFRPQGWSRVDKTLVLGNRHYEPSTARVDEEWLFIRGGEEHARSSSIRIYTYHELHDLFADAGFTDLRPYDTPTHEPFRLGSRRLTLVGTRPVVPHPGARAPSGRAGRETL